MAGDDEETALLKKAFQNADVNGDGVISRSEMKDLLVKCCKKMAEEDIEYLLKAFDKNGDGLLQYEEFVNWLNDEEAGVKAADVAVQGMGKPAVQGAGKPVALVYRGPASVTSCEDAVAMALADKYSIVFTGPKDKPPLEALVMPGAAIWVQPGGGDDVDVAWAACSGHKDALRAWVEGGGRYIGICMGAFLAGGLGYEVLGPNAETMVYIEMPDAQAKDLKTYIIDMTWGNKVVKCFYQGGPAFDFKDGAPGEVVARYSNNAIASLIVPMGKGRVGVIGPHPEVTQEWYDGIGDGAQACVGLFVEFVDRTVANAA